MPLIETNQISFRRAMAANELTDDEERENDARIGTLGWPRSSSFGPASSAMCSYLQKSPANSLRTLTANHAKYTKRIRVFRVVRGQKLRPQNSMCSRRRTKSVSHGRQPKILCSGPSGWEDGEKLRPAQTFRKETLASPHPLNVRRGFVQPWNADNQE